MAKYTKSQKAETTDQRRDQRFKEFTVAIATKNQFYHLVSLLNKELGHGRQNWNFAGRPLRKIRRFDTFNTTVLALQHSWKSQSDNDLILQIRTTDLTLKVHPSKASSVSKVLLEFAK